MPPKQKLDEGVLIHPASPDDAAAIVAVLDANRDDSSLYRKSLSAVRNEVENFLVARTAEGTVVGCAGIYRDRTDLVELYAVAILPEWQGKGLGTRIMEASETRAKMPGVCTLWLSTTKVEFFSRFGFKPISRLELPRTVLLRKLWLTLHQPITRWLPAIFGRHTFMRKQAS